MNVWSVMRWAQPYRTDRLPLMSVYPTLGFWFLDWGSDSSLLWDRIVLDPTVAPVWGLDLMEGRLQGVIRSEDRERA